MKDIYNVDQVCHSYRHNLRVLRLRGPLWGFLVPAQLRDSILVMHLNGSVQEKLVMRCLYVRAMEEARWQYCM